MSIPTTQCRIIDERLISEKTNISDLSDKTTFVVRVIDAKSPFFQKQFLLHYRGETKFEINSEIECIIVTLHASRNDYLYAIPAEELIKEKRR